MEDNNQLSFPEEDEDLEALRLAALQSLKKKSNNDTLQMGAFIGVKDKLNHFNGSPRNKHKRGKFSRPQQGRQTRNGQFNGWSRNSNLIAVPVISENEKLSQNKETATEDVPKLVLPQDRYCKLKKSPDKSDTLTSSKFDRYDNSDESEEESEDEETKSLGEEKPELKRSDSLEALMAELENEIQGVPSKPPEQIKPKQIKKKRKISVNASPTTPSITTESDNNQPVTVLKENLKPEQTELKKPFPRQQQRKWVNKPRRHFPPPPPLPNLIPPMAPPPELIPPPVVPFVPPPVQSFPPYNPLGFDSGVYVHPSVVFEAPPPHLPPIHLAPPIYERPLSPLTINTDAFSTGTLAVGQLSPRSAAFVMENRAIIEKRKRRSYSRSPSPPRFRRSKSPKRLSVSPKRLSKSPKRRSLSPPSPVRKVLPPRTNSPNKKSGSIHDRLGLKSSNKTESEEDKNKKVKEETSPKKEPLDPVLEARRKKFERNETITAGVIRLKKQSNEGEEEEEEENPKKEENDELDEDALLEEEGDEGDQDDSLVLDPTTLFSDEETDNSDNEGRFKTKQESSQKVAVLPFTKLINGSKNNLKNDLAFDNKKQRRRSPVKKSSSKVGKKNENKSIKQPMGFADRKIEIKIRNPAKYERSKSGERKVEVSKKDEGEKETEGAVVADSTEDVNVTDGDLRAQLSRKRAERQKHPLPDVVPSRLLQNALQGVGFSRKGKKAKNKDEVVTDGKLPIRLRLGMANNNGSKGRKLNKNKGSQEQV